MDARSKDVPLIVITVLCLRFAYFNDTEMSQNNDIPKPLLNARGWFQHNMKHLMIVFVFACFPLEERISKEFNLDTFFRRQAHTLTAMHVAYQAVVTYNNLYLERNGPSESVEEKQYEDERATIASYLGFSIYIAGAIYIVMTLVRSGCI